MTAKLFIVAFSSVVVVAMSVLQETTSITNSITLAGAIATIIAALFVGIVNVIAARSAARTAIAPLKADVTEIKAHVNSEKTRDQGVIANLRSQIEMQQKVIEQLNQASALLAQAKAMKDIAQAAVVGVVSPLAPQAAHAVVSGPATVVLKEIEKNTKETAENTAKTDANMQEMKDDQQR